MPQDKHLQKQIKAIEEGISTRYIRIMSIKEWEDWGKDWWIEWQNMTKAWVDQCTLAFWGTSDY